jgi:hypothetical protein
MEILLLIPVLLIVGAIGAVALKLYLKRNFPGVYQMMYQPEEFDKLMAQIKTGSKA